MDTSAEQQAELTYIQMSMNRSPATCLEMVHARFTVTHPGEPPLGDFSHGRTAASHPTRTSGTISQQML